MMVRALLLALALMVGATPAARAAGLPPVTGAGAVVQDPASGRVYVAQPASSVVFVLAPRSMALARILRVPADPSALLVDPAHDLLYVASAGAGVVSLYDERTYRLVHRYAVGGHPSSLALVARGRSLLVGDGVDGTVRAVTLRGRSRGQSIQVFVAGAAAASTVLLAPRSAAPGTRVRVWAYGFKPGEPVELSWGVQRLRLLTANEAGIVTTGFRVPRKARIDAHLVILDGLQGTTSKSTLLTVVPAPPVPRRPRMATTQAQAQAHKGPSLLQQVVALAQAVWRLDIVVPVPARAAAPAVPAHGRGTQGAQGAQGAQGTRAAHHPVQAVTTVHAVVRLPAVGVAAEPLLLLLYMRARRRRKRRKGQTGKGKRGKRGAAQAPAPAAPALRKAS